ncbi:testin-like [Diaphorina citri]|uniref:Testin-like n=1 Tax=Diaphorina citri TaxID=121845 RepID=A0A3Q0JNK9_DIACI|nr:testin-like [Diaphorina citri]XP_026688797.1 testin-like [Diaphorina citri]
MATFEEGNQIKTQKWMEILESKNQKGHKLAHDLGAGSPCLQCKDNCPGLDLHFWR